MVSRAALFPLLFLAGGACGAAEVAGVKVPETAQVEARQLVLNGAGLRTRFFFKVYVIGLYLPEKTRDAAAVLARPGPKRIALHMLRDVGAESFSQALVDGLQANHTATEYRALEPRVKQLEAIMAQVGEAKKGMNIALDWTGGATRVSVGASAVGEPIPGEDFYRALLRIWLGENAVQDDVKSALLGN
ncbi:MAG TPA: chalcone isomerase family protein [Burkholderiales bacterium]